MSPTENLEIFGVSSVKIEECLQGKFWEVAGENNLGVASENVKI
jgi:hypothetical protein